MQPAEVLIIVGAAAGIILVANPWEVIRQMLSGVARTFRRPVHSRASFLRNLRMLYEVFVYSQRAGGIVALEADVEEPSKSAIFSRYTEFLRDEATRDFICDSLRMLIIGATTPHELDLLMDLDIDVQRRGRQEPVNALSSVADSLPGLGIVAAVLGVVITMEAIGGSPETIGQKVAAALVGTFLGILLCYGVVSPGGAPRKHGRGTDAVLPGDADRGRVVCSRIGSHPGNRIRAALHSGRTAPFLPRHGNQYQARSPNSGVAKTGGPG
jgi:chemotaxis protein MotA